LARYKLVEAAARGGQPDLAADALRQLTERTSVAGTPWALGTQARCQVLLSEGAEADALYREAIEQLTHTRSSAHPARAHLLYGEWLRRENRRRDARDQLRTGYEALRRIGAEAFAQRARREMLDRRDRASARRADLRRAHRPGSAGRAVNSSRSSAMQYSTRSSGRTPSASSPAATRRTSSPSWP